MSTEPSRGQSSALFNELMDELRSLESHLLDHPNALGDEQTVVESYKWIFSILQVALDCFVWSDTSRPHFVDIVGRTKKWGGDNSDAFYQHVALDPTRTYRVEGWRGDAVYLSLTVYGGTDDGHYSDRIVGTVNDSDLTFDEDGRFEFWISPEPQDGPGILLAPDAVVGITRDYLAEPEVGHRTEWRIHCDEPAEPYRETDEGLARRLRAVITWLKDQAAMVPLGMGDPNVVDPPYPVPQATFGWAAGDAAYAMGSFALADGEALVLRGTSPENAFWNMCLWNPLLHTYNYDHDRVTINGEQLQLEADGSWVIVISDEDPGHPNWVSTQGHDRGRIWFRWFHPVATPDEIDAQVVAVSGVSAPVAS
ncbi:hypothetical protein BH10ACT3_BH10ACT3_06710 [soil metagenome]